MRSWYTYSDVYQREDPDGDAGFALAQLVQKLLKNKLPCSEVPPFWLFDPCDVILPWPKNDLSKNCRARPPVSIGIYRLSLASFFRDLRGMVTRSVLPKLAQIPVGARVKV